MAALKDKSRTMSKADKDVFKSGLKIMQANDHVLKAMVGMESLQPSTHMVVLTEISLPATMYQEAKVLMTRGSWQDTMSDLCKRFQTLALVWLQFFSDRC